MSIQKLTEESMLPESPLPRQKKNTLNRTEVHDLLTIHRQSGDISNWKRVNRRFLNTLRKQFLIWRTLGTEERERYLTEGEEATAAISTA